VGVSETNRSTTIMACGGLRDQSIPLLRLYWLVAIAVVLRWVPWGWTFVAGKAAINAIVAIDAFCAGSSPALLSSQQIACFGFLLCCNHVPVGVTLFGPTLLQSICLSRCLRRSPMSCILCISFLSLGLSSCRVSVHLSTVACFGFPLRSDRLYPITP
jgi:hypothetical protein